MLIIRFLFLSSIFIISLFSNVELNLPKEVIKGEPLVFSLTISANDIKMPKLDTINSYSVQEISSSTSTNIINNKITRSIRKIYSLYPSKDFEFPSLKFIIDGKEFFTKSQKITLKNSQKTVSPIFDLSLKANNKDLYVSENFVLTVVFKYKKNSNIVDLSFEKPNFDNFWYKQLPNTKQYEENGFIVQELNFLLFPLKEGILKVNPLKINAQIIDASNSYSLFSNTSSNIKIYSNELEFNVKKLPSNTNLIGKFDIKASVDKSKVKQGEAISYKLVITGNGNIEDIKDIKLNIKNITIYDNKPKIKAKYEDGKYKGTYTKVFSIIPNDSITIPKIKIEYFDKDLEQVISKYSDEINIVVEKNNEIKKVELLQKAKKEVKEKQVIKIVEKTSQKDRIIFFTLGIIVGMLILGLYFYVINYKRINKSNETSLIKKVKSSNTKDELLKILAVYIKINSSLDELIFKLEEQKDIKIIKKEIIKKLKELKL
ncbi:BatD family protein [Arcobacter peruensis]|uniref:BatD family protein n=1 Tax=Arcobacter peruensis TaxID=2320140 RepID=UPI000F080262|nr:BatD family protein [Arcobacter peruensis]